MVLCLEDKKRQKNFLETMWFHLPQITEESQGRRISIVLDDLNVPKKYQYTVCLQNSRMPELVVLVDFVFPWGLEYPVVFLPHGLFTLWCLQIS
jgi:hypothetical protein